MSANIDHRSERRLRATTILGMRRNGTVALAGDGQVTIGDVVLKHGARKVRTLGGGRVVAGFAGAVADALTLLAKFESQLKSADGDLRRAAVELTKEWRTDRYLRRLEAELIVGDPDSILILSGEGDVIEPDDGIAAIGAGAPYAAAAAKALASHSELGPREIVEVAMGIAATMCIFTNDRFSIESVSQADDHAHAEAADERADDVDQMPLAGLEATPEGADDEDDDDGSDQNDHREGRPRAGVRAW